MGFHEVALSKIRVFLKEGAIGEESLLCSPKV